MTTGSLPPLPTHEMKGILPRSALNERLKAAIEQAQQTDLPFSLLLLDIDHFKSVNDAFGHSTGDTVLIEFARRLLRLSRSHDLIFRYGGDEFIILFPNTPKPQATAVAQRLLTRIAEQPFPTEPPLLLSISVGVVSYPSDGQTAEDLFEAADRRHYLAKRSGRGRVVAEDPPTAQSRTAVSIEEPSRLLERDQALEEVLCFLSAIPDQPRSLFTLYGAPHSGKSRFLSEVRKIARLRGYAVLALRGGHALKARLYGALDLARREWDGLPAPSKGLQALQEAILQWLIDKGNAGLLITLDDVDQIDQSSLEYIQQLFLGDSLPNLSLVYANSSATIPDPFIEKLSRTVPSAAALLEPISPAGVRLWIRHSLQWEAPQEFVDWLHKETNGLPGLLQIALTYLLENGIVTHTAGGRNVRPDFASLPLREQLDKIANRPPGRAISNLPTFIGREDEMFLVQKLLNAHRMVTILGPGGVGKSRLALQVAAENRKAYRNGAYLVRLAAISDPDYLPSTLIQEMNLSLSGGADPRQQLLQQLQHRETLLVLDNFENVTEGAELLAEILNQASGVHLLITSRSRLDLAEEHILELSGLPCPPQDDPHIEQYSAVQLFVQSARRVRSDFSLTAENAHCLAKICRLVSGMPLGIELAASWTQTLSCDEIAHKIESGMSFLSPQQSGLSEEQRSMKAIFDTFWQSLSPMEQAIVSQLSVFKGRFSEEAARQVTGASPFFLEALVARSFLRRTPRGAYEPHELLRQYAHERLTEQPNLLNAALDQHCSYYIHFLQQRKLTISQERRVIEEIELEIGNVRAALQRAIEQVNLPGLEALSTFSLFCYQIGHLHEGLSFTQRAVQALRNHTQPSPLLLGQLLQQQAMFLAWLNENEAAIACTKEALQIAAELSTPGLEAEARRVLGQILFQTSDYAAARAELQAALKLAQEHNRPGLEAEILLNLGNIALETEIAHLEVAQNYYAQALAIFRRENNLSRQCGALNNLGVVALYRDDYDSAQAYFEQNLTLARHINDRISQGTALINLGSVATFRRRLTQAQQHLMEARELLHAVGARQDEGVAIWTLGFVYLLGGDFAGAHTFLEQSLEQMREIQSRASACRIYADLILLAFYEGRYLAGRDLSRQALLMADELGLRDTSGYTLTILGHCLTALGKLEEAQLAYQQAEKLFEDINRPFNSIDPLAGLAQLSLARDSRLRALGYTEKILDLLQRAETAGTLDNQLCALIEPSRVYLTCAQALQSIGDERAGQVLATGYDKLMAWANAIENTALRRSFLENIPSNRLLVEKAQQTLPSDKV